MSAARLVSNLPLVTKTSISDRATLFEGGGLVKRGVLALGSALALAAAGPAAAQSSAVLINVKAVPLVDALQAVARQSGVELLFDRGQVEGLRAVPVRGRLTAQAALQRLLVDTNLTVRRSGSGALIIEVPAAAPLARADAVVPELLVIGRRTQNADIRRFETDVQPYKVTTRDDLTNAHRDTLDDFFRSRITTSTQIAPGILGTSGDVRSSIDLRGLGTAQTLVLVDGRRLPSTVGSGVGDFGQADINAIPLGAIKRIETLTGTAGGIYGFGALGGVVNVVLDRDTRGLDVRVSQGLTSRGDAHRQKLEARLGRTSRDGQTDVTVSAGLTTSSALLNGQRDYLVRDRRETFAHYPEYIISAYANSFGPSGNSVGVFSTSGGPLMLKPKYGGGEIPSGYTYLPAGFSGGAGELALALTQHGGQLDVSASKSEADSSLGSWSPWSGAMLFNARHRFGDDMAVYVDAVVMSERGEYRDLVSNGQLLITGSSAVNPFDNLIDVSFPVSGMGMSVSTRFDTRRYTAGFEAGLPLGWRGVAEAGWGVFKAKANISSRQFLGPSFLGDPGNGSFDPFGDWSAFQKAAAAATTVHVLANSSVRNDFQEQSLRLAGPIFSTAAGPAMLTLLVDRYEERIAPSTATSTSIDDQGGPSSTTQTSSDPASSATLSFYAELRTRVFGDIAPSWFLRDLELQLAARHDRREDHFSSLSSLSLTTFETEYARVEAAFSGTAYTAGAKVSPTRWLMLRGSYATGHQPPPREALGELDLVDYPLAAFNDPKRGGLDFNAPGVFLLKAGGDKDLKTVRASTLSLGAMVTPFGPDGARFSVDYSHIRRTRDVVAFSDQDVLAHEDFWPERVVRAPLTDADRVRGYTGGQILILDARVANAASLDAETIDARLAWPLAFLEGRLRVYGDATYYVRNRTQGLFQATSERIGFQTSPLKWRANGGAEWSRDALSFGFNVQYLGSYLTYPADSLTAFFIDRQTAEHLQGSSHIPAQTYVDLYGAWRVPGKALHLPHELTVDFGIIDVFDKAPPRETLFQPFASLDAQGYSQYGDPRRRRFELVLSTRF